MLIPIIIIVFLIVAVGMVVVFVVKQKKSDGNGEGSNGKKVKAKKAKRGKAPDVAFRDAEKRIAHNPHDISALLTLGEHYFDNEDWDKAYTTYGTLCSLVPSHDDIDKFVVCLRYGQSALKKGITNEALHGFQDAMQVRPDNFDVNFNLGQIEFDKGEFEKAIHFLQKARIAEPDNPPVLRTLGHAYFKMKKYKEALTCIKAAIQSAPNDKESLFTLAQCYWESDQMEQALKIYNQLRSDPAVGGAACLASGTINMQHRQIQKAIEDFEMGLQCKNLKPDNMIEMKYRLAVCLIQSNNIGKALTYLNEINAVRPNFKDTPALITRYQEMNANRNLQIYLMGPVQEFQELCKQVVHIYYRHAKVKITEITMERNDWADILADIDTPQWSDSVMFRFIRLQGAIGEMVVRDFHGHIKEVKAGKGICITVGNYTDEAKHFTEARLIDLVEKHKFLQVLNKIDTTKIGATKK